MERVKQFYQVTLLNEEYMLTADDFHKFQQECSEIAAFKSHGDSGCTHCQHQDQDTTEFDHVADEPEILVELHQDGISIDGREYLIETKSAHKAIAEVVKTGLETKPMKTNILTDRVDLMPPANAKKDVSQYVKYHEEGMDMPTIKALMLEDGFCPKTSLSYYAAKILKASTRVIHVDAPVETDEETIERCKRQNEEDAKDRKKPKMAVKL